MKEKILPAAFNVWKAPGKPRMDPDESLARQKVCILLYIYFINLSINAIGVRGLDSEQLEADKDRSQYSDHNNTD